MKNGFPKQIKIVEIGVRDGLQNKKVQGASAVKIALINRLLNAANALSSKRTIAKAGMTVT